MGQTASTDMVVGLSSGEPELDGALGNGGYPLGRIVEIVGAPGARDVIANLALLAVREAQRAGQRAMLIDGTGAFNEIVASIYGIDTTRLVVVRPASVEQAMGLLATTLGAELGKLALVVVHMLDELATPAESDRGLSASRFDVERRAVADVLPRVERDALAKRTAVLFTAASDVRYHRGAPLRFPGSPVAGDVLRKTVTLRIEVRCAEGAPIQAHVARPRAGRAAAKVVSLRDDLAEKRTV